jgi:hypothetical protein
VGKPTAQQWRDCEYVKQVRCRQQSDDLFGSITSHHVQRRRLHEDQRLERTRSHAPLDEIGRMHIQRFGGIERLFLNHDQPIRAPIGQRPKQDRIHEREDGRVGGDSNCQREDRDDGKSGTLSERPESIRDVLAKPVGIHTSV